MSEWTCLVCGEPLANDGAESRGDGDLYDTWSCDEHGRIYDVHADFCECGCGGGQIEEVYDAEYFAPHLSTIPEELDYKLPESVLDTGESVPGEPPTPGAT